MLVNREISMPLYGAKSGRSAYIYSPYWADLPSVEVDPDTICQCTGFKDGNDNLIFEGDILKVDIKEALHMGHIKWLPGSWAVKFLGDHKYVLLSDLFGLPEVMVMITGNIYDGNTPCNHCDKHNDCEEFATIQVGAQHMSLRTGGVISPSFSCRDFREKEKTHD